MCNSDKCLCLNQGQLVERTYPDLVHHVCCLLNPHLPPCQMFPHLATWLQQQVLWLIHLVLQKTLLHVSWTIGGLPEQQVQLCLEAHLERVELMIAFQV